ncbi:MAG TPA: hypothetical protein VGO11_22870, partial [Chthoniobacteraceae bacterium]|nr:hypothetical protein [Chthoniobacteraceae bacterium]
LKDGPQGVVWTRTGKVNFRGVKFGEGRALGVRHLRIGFTQPVAAGSVLVRGGGALSVLKAGAKYPGDLADDAQWLPAARLVEDAEKNAEVDQDGYALWVLPPGTQTRALRFSHVPAPGDREMAGWLGGVWVSPDRLGNVAPQALAQSEARDDFSAKLNDELANKGWQAWDNGEQGAALPLSPEHPAVVTLTWPAPVKLSGLCLLWAGFSAVEIDAFTGPAEGGVRDAAETNWKKVGESTKIDPAYPLPLAPNWVSFAEPVSTRAVRIRMTKGPVSNHPHLKEKVKDGRRAWLGEVLALVPLDKATLASLVLPKSVEEPPPIPVKFTLPAPGVVTLVIEDTTAHRVRNLVSETPFPAGANTAWWDGSDDLLRDPQAAKHGLYHIPTRPVAPGTYKVLGLWHPPVQLHYEFSVYNAGKPAWTTEDKTGGWMTTHTPPTSVAYVPGTRTADGQPLIFIGAFVAEGGHGLQWLHEDGTKLGGQGWVGGTWTGAPTLAVDNGPDAIFDNLVYVGSVWEGELRLTAKTKKLEDRPVAKMQLGDDPRIKKPADGEKPQKLEGFDGGDKNFVLSGLAIRNGYLVCSMIRQNELVFISATDGHVVGRQSVPSPRGVAFDAKGGLLVLTEKSLVRFPRFTPERLDRGSGKIIFSGLEDPRQVTTDAEGNFLITDRGQSHQVKRFSPEGKPLPPIGLAGAPAVGMYEPKHMNNPNGLALDSQGRLWVAEADNFPRRVSVWSTKGELERAFYGPTEYGGGGVLDPQDKTRFFYKGMEFKLDWEKGTDQLVRVFHRPDPLLEAHGGHFSPDTPLYPNDGKGPRYFTSCYTHNPTGGDHVAFLWSDDGKSARLVAAMGDARAWSVLLQPEFISLWPEGSKPEAEHPKPEETAVFLWQDRNWDGHPQPNELRFQKGVARGITVADDLSFVVARFEEHAIRFPRLQSIGVVSYFYNFQPRGPEGDFGGHILGPAGGQPQSSGGDQALMQPARWTITTNAPLPFSPYGLGGAYNGEPRWSYPSLWPGLHASHEAAVPDRPGEVIGTTRLLGGWVTPPGEGGPMFCVNGNMGNMYLFTADGLFVSTLFNDIRLRPNWAAPVAIRDMDVTGVSLHDENFWPSITQTPDGKVYLVDGARTSLVRIDGLDGIKRLPEQTITVTAADLEKSRDWFARAEAKRQQQRGSGVLTVALRTQPPQVDGKLEDWPATTDWATIDRRGTKANFNSQSKPYDVSAAVAVSGDRLYAAWRSNEKDLLGNSAETPNALFKTGGCLDLMIGADPAAPLDRKAPAAGDQRLLVTLVKGKPMAMLYRAKVPGTKQPVAFSSPWRTINLDVVEDVTDRLVFAADGAGNFELSLPLETLHWQPKAGQTIRADLGILRGANFQTTQRVYWSNKATAITADVPSEAELTPGLWGKWVVKAE